MLRTIADKYKGGVFQYRFNSNIETIIQNVIEWKEKGREIALLQKERENEEEVSMEKDLKFVKEPIQPACDCVIV
jgi:type II restriction/modification system DNA methylase subunit YeeA